MFLAPSNAPLPGVQLASVGHVVLFYARLVALADRLVRGTSDVEARTDQRVPATA